MKLIDMIKSDLERLCDPTIVNFFKYYCFSQGTTFPYQVWYRIFSECKQHFFIKYTFGLLAYFFYRHYGFKYGISFDTNIHVGKGLKIVHGYGVIVNCSYIGDNFTIYQNCTFGSDKNNNVPIVGDNVTVFTGSIVIGDIKLEDNCTIGANSFVNSNVSEGSIVVGNPAHPINKNK